MKKIFTFAFLLFGKSLFAQIDSTSKLKKNEININFLETVIGGIIPITYECFIDRDESIALKAFFLDRHYNDLNSREYRTFSIQGQYLVYFSKKKQNAGFNVYPFYKYSTGNYGARYKNGTSPSTFISQRLNGHILGFGLGYKYVWKNKISFGLSSDFGSVLNQNSYYINYISIYNNVKYVRYYSRIDTRFGVNAGFRF